MALWVESQRDRIESRLRIGDERLNPTKRRASRRGWGAIGAPSEEKVIDTEFVRLQIGLRRRTGVEQAVKQNVPFELRRDAGRSPKPYRATKRLGGRNDRAGGGEAAGGEQEGGGEGREAATAGGLPVGHSPTRW